MNDLDAADEPAVGLAAIVLAGGQGSRMGGIDKPALSLDGATLLERVVAAARSAHCDPVVVVGREVGGGPVAALAAGLSGLRASEVIVLAGDLARPERVIPLLAATVAGDAAVLIDPGGREQWLAARYRVGALRSAIDGLAGGPAGASFRAVVRGLELAFIPADAAAIADIDTWEDYERERSPHG